MNERIVHNWNQRVSEDDVVYHLGDFCFRGGKQGGNNKAKYWEDQLNGKIIHVKGNHDSNNGTKAIITNAIMEFGGYVVLAQHQPPFMKPEVPEFCDFVICGHVHNLWKHFYNKPTEENMKDPYVINVPVINVGVDCWKFFPVSMDELLAYYHQIIK